MVYFLRLFYVKNDKWFEKFKNKIDEIDNKINISKYPFTTYFIECIDYYIGKIHKINIIKEKQIKQISQNKEDIQDINKDDNDYIYPAHNNSKPENINSNKTYYIQSSSPKKLSHSNNSSGRFNLDQYYKSLSYNSVYNMNNTGKKGKNDDRFCRNRPNGTIKEKTNGGSFPIYHFFAPLKDVFK